MTKIPKELVEYWAAESLVYEQIEYGEAISSDRLLNFAQRAAAHAVAQREAELMAVGMEPECYGRDDITDEILYGYTAEQLAAARLQGAEEGYRKGVEAQTAINEALNAEQASAVNQGLLDLLARAHDELLDGSVGYDLRQAISAAIAAAEAHTGEKT